MLTTGGGLGVQRLSPEFGDDEPFFWLNSSIFGVNKGQPPGSLVSKHVRKNAISPDRCIGEVAWEPKL